MIVQNPQDRTLSTLPKSAEPNHKEENVEEIHAQFLGAVNPLHPAVEHGRHPDNQQGHHDVRIREDRLENLRLGLRFDRVRENH